MPEITKCPECQRKLNVADEQLGGPVRCPLCGNEFTAEKYVASRSAPPAPAPAEPEDRREPPPRRRDDYDRRDDDDRDDDRPRRRRPYRRDYGEKPHRGSTIQALGILSICFCWFPMVCWITGGMALGMAATDLAEMERGVMDPSGRAATQTGRTCAIAGLVLSAVSFVFCCGVGALIGVANNQ